MKKTLATLGIVLLGASGIVSANVIDKNKIPNNYKLKTDKNLIIGQKQKGLDVKYAYKSNKKVVDDISEIKEKRTKYSRTFKTSNKNEFVTEFIAGVPQYYEDENGEWWIAEYATTTKEFYDKQTKPTIIENLISYFNKNALAATDTFYPDPDPETSTVDGYIYHFDNNWDIAHDGTTGLVVDDSAVAIFIGTQYGTNPGPYLISRNILLFDTSSIGSGYEVSSATLSAYVYQIENTDNDGDDWIVVVDSNPASNTSLSTADYDQVGDAINNPTEGSNRIDLTSMSINAYTDFTLDSNGIGWIDMQGITKLGFREGHDVLDSATDVQGNGNYMYYYSAETGGTSFDPKLTVTYSAIPNNLIEFQSDGIIEFSSNGELNFN